MPASLTDRQRARTPGHRVSRASAADREQSRHDAAARAKRQL